MTLGCLPSPAGAFGLEGGHADRCWETHWLWGEQALYGSEQLLGAKVALSLLWP